MKKTHVVVIAGCSLFLLTGCKSAPQAIQNQPQNAAQNGTQQKVATPSPTKDTTTSNGTVVSPQLQPGAAAQDMPIRRGPAATPDGGGE